MEAAGAGGENAGESVSARMCIFNVEKSIPFHVHRYKHKHPFADIFWVRISKTTFVKVLRVFKHVTNAFRTCSFSDEPQCPNQSRNHLEPFLPSGWNLIIGCRVKGNSESPQSRGTHSDYRKQSKGWGNLNVDDVNISGILQTASCDRMTAHASAHAARYLRASRLHIAAREVSIGPTHAGGKKRTTASRRVIKDEDGGRQIEREREDTG